MAETIYFNALSGKQGKYGIRLSGKVEKIIEELNKHVNEKGYINLEVLPKREPDKYGNTHYVKVDTWQPASKDESANVERAHSEAGKEYKKEEPFNANDPEDTLPF